MTPNQLQNNLQNSLQNQSQSQNLAVLSTILNLTPERVFLLLNHYQTLENAILDNFLSIRNQQTSALKPSYIRELNRESKANKVPKAQKYQSEQEIGQDLFMEAQKVESQKEFLILDTQTNNFLESFSEDATDQDGENSTQNSTQNTLSTPSKATLKFLDKWTDIQDFYKKSAVLLKSLEAEKIAFTTILDQDFPRAIRDIQPLKAAIMYYQGSLSALQDLSFDITVVGSRSVSEYCKKIMQKILPQVCQRGVGIISGLALGADEIAHQIAVKNYTKTIAVIGSGLDQRCFYPNLNWKLKQEILANAENLILSEYPPGYLPSKYTFPRRNLILAGLGKLTYVVQAGLKSGSLITASEAQKMNKTVVISPASIFDDNFLGSLELIKKGARIALDPFDIFDILGLENKPNFLDSPSYSAQNPQAKSPALSRLSSAPNSLANQIVGNKKGISYQTNIQNSKVWQTQTSRDRSQNGFENMDFLDLSEGEMQVYKKLSPTSQSIEQLSESLKKEMAELGATLTLLEIKGLAKNLGENSWIRS